MNAGWIKLHRSMLDWEWYEDQNVFRLFTYCLMKANHADKNWRGTVIPRGSFVTGREDLAAKTGLTPQQVRGAITKLKSTGEITTKATNKGTTVIICNYDTYQCRDEGSNQRNNQQDNQQATSEQPTNNQRITTNKNVRIKEGKNSLLGKPNKERVSKSSKSKESKRKPKGLTECIDYAASIGVSKFDAEGFYDSQESGGWTRGGKALADWKAALRTWKRNGWLPSQKQQAGNEAKPKIEYKDGKF